MTVWGRYVNLSIATHSGLSSFIEPDMCHVRSCARQDAVSADPGTHPAVSRPEVIG